MNKRSILLIYHFYIMYYLGLDMEEKSKLTIISIKIPMEQLKQLDSLVQQGLYASRSEAIREAIRLLLSGYR